MKKVVIDRARWDRGEPSKCKLLTEEGKMCCLGFVCLTDGASEKELGAAAMPMSLHNSHVRFPALVKNNGKIAWAASLVNDSVQTSESQREKGVAEILAEAGYEVEFVG